MSDRDDLIAHLQQGTTTLCRMWLIRRKDGVQLAFTDRDLDLELGGTVFRASGGLSGSAIEKSGGLSVDNTEGLGALVDDSLSEDDIVAGRFDQAEVTIWLANWQAPEQRIVLFKGLIGDIKRAGGAFKAELRGLSEVLNQPRGRIFQSNCSAVLGDSACGVDLSNPLYSVTTTISGIAADGAIQVPGLSGFSEGFFSHGRLVGVSPRIAGVVGALRSDKVSITGRNLYLWFQPLLAFLPGEQIRIEAGCDRMSTTCKVKFNNYNNYRGFPHIPSEDWLLVSPSSNGMNDGGSMN